jgi:hypothetical protein
MKLFLSCLVVFGLAEAAVAYNPVPAEPSEPYAVMALEGDPYIEQQFLGDLEDYPDMYELTTDVSIDLTLQVRQRAGKRAVPFGLIIVRQNDDDGGVTEVLRSSQELDTWQKTRFASLGITFLEGEKIVKAITPGTYRIEVSTPDNKGAYMLQIGDEPKSAGFFTSMFHIYKTQSHFGYTPLHMLFSSYVYYLIGIMLVLYGMYYTFRHRYSLGSIDVA